jgi:hypothetical protein
MSRLDSGSAHGWMLTGGAGRAHWLELAVVRCSLKSIEAAEDDCDPAARLEPVLEENAESSAS